MVRRVRQANFYGNHSVTRLQLQMRSKERELMKSLSTINQRDKKSSIFFQSFRQDKIVVTFFTDFTLLCHWLQ